MTFESIDIKDIFCSNIYFRLFIVIRLENWSQKIIVRRIEFGSLNLDNGKEEYFTGPSLLRNSYFFTKFKNEF
jgi:hypothetical protein